MANENPEVSVAYWQQRLAEAETAVNYASEQLSIAGLKLIAKQRAEFGYDSEGRYLIDERGL